MGTEMATEGQFDALRHAKALAAQHAEHDLTYAGSDHEELAAGILAEYVDGIDHYMSSAYEMVGDSRFNDPNCRLAWALTFMERRYPDELVRHRRKLLEAAWETVVRRGAPW